MRVKIFFAVTFCAVLFLAAGTALLRAQAPSPSDAAPLLDEGDLEQLVAPIALYPDPLVALILTGSTVPTDIVLADRYVHNGGDPNAIDSQNWDDSVKGLARYPDVLKMMDDNLDWTNQLGAAVLGQQADVMTAIQSQRAKAQALGNLESTPQQQVVTDQNVIEILPADPQTIYVPVYDPQVIYVERAPAIPLITFGIGFAMGAWIGGDCDWHNHGIYRGGYYRPGYGWGGNNANITINNNYVWRPNPNKPKPRPPYHPGRPGTPGGGNGQLPGWHRPPGGNKPLPGRPGGPGNPGNVRPQPKPTPPGNGSGNRPGGPGNRPGGGGGNGKPQIQPAPGAGPGHAKPAPGNTKPAPNRPVQPTTRPAPGFDREKPNTKRPVHTQPAQPHIQPATPRPQPRPATPTPRPAATRPAAPATRPAPHQQSPSTKHSSAPAARPQPQRPAPARSNQNR